MMRGFYLLSGQLVTESVVSVCSRVPIFGVHVVVIIFGERCGCVTNPVSIFYISPRTDKKHTHHIGLCIDM